MKENKMNNLESFEKEQLYTDCIVGGKHVCTEWTSGDGHTSGYDLYDTETCNVAYFE